jgi:methyl-accepting chemotaxis protein
MRPIVMLTFAVCAAMTVVLCGYLYWVSSLLRRISDNLGDVNDMVGDVIGHATTIVPDLQHANRTLGSISGALPLLYGLAEKTVTKKKRQGGQPVSARRSNRVGAGQAGAAVVANLMTVAIVLVAFSTVVILLQRTTSTANSIDHKAKRIARTGQGINTATDSVIQLNRTNETAASILTTAQPLQGKLDQIVHLAQSIDGHAGSILGTAKTINGTGATVNGTAGTINKTAKTINATAGDIHATALAIDGTAGKINGTAKDINGQAAAILDVAKRINGDVAAINQSIDTTLGIVSGVKGDTGNILGQAQLADKLARCIDQRLGSPGAC